MFKLKANGKLSGDIYMTEEISRSLFGEGSKVMIYIPLEEKGVKERTASSIAGKTRNECYSIIFTALFVSVAEELNLRLGTRDLLGLSCF